MSRFDGNEGYVPDRDDNRLSAQLLRVARVMLDGEWRTLRNIAEAIDAPESSVSARLRDLRKDKFGSWNVERRYVGDGLHEYRLLP